MPLLALPVHQQGEHMSSLLTTEQLIGYASSVIEKHGHLAPVALRLKLKATSLHKGMPVKTAATDGDYLLFNPHWASTLTPKEIQGVILHEIWHVAAGHPWRGIGYPKNESNIAMDHEVNGICIESRATLPADRVYDPKYKNWNWERIYEDLFETPDDNIITEPPERIVDERGDKEETEDQPAPKQAEKDQESDQPDESKSDQSDSSDESDQPESDESDESEQSDQSDQSGSDESDEPESDESDQSGSDQSDESDESDVEGPAWGEVWDATHDDGSPLTQEEIDDALDHLQEEIIRGETEMIRAGKSNGYGGNAIIDRVMRPTMHWTKLVTALIKKRGRVVGSTYRRPSRRYLATGIITPHKIKSSIDEIVIAVDVSYSIDMRRLRAFFDHLDRLRQTVYIKKIHILPFTDIAESGAVKVVTHGQKLPRDFQIGGGTAFAPVFNWVRRNAKRAEMVIVFTDLGAYDYGVKPKCPVLWASSDPINKYNKPPFGKAVEIDMEGR